MLLLRFLLYIKKKITTMLIRPLISIKEKCSEWLIQSLQSIGEKKTGTFTCKICMEPKPLIEKFTSKRCSHHCYCSGCISLYIVATVQDNRSEIKCPTPGCTEPLDPLSCRPILPTDAFVQWCDALCESAVLRVSRAYCPFRDCSVLVLNECSHFVTECQCPGCYRWFCFLCQAPLHVGYRCNVYNARVKEDVLFYQLIRAKGWKRCPRCNQCVEDVSGRCHRIRCRCGCGFCYYCRQELSWFENYHLCHVDKKMTLEPFNPATRFGPWPFAAPFGPWPFAAPLVPRSFNKF